jgi:hypothetical protein
LWQREGRQSELPVQNRGRSCLESNTLYSQSTTQATHLAPSPVPTDPIDRWRVAVPAGKWNVSPCDIRRVGASLLLGAAAKIVPGFAGEELGSKIAKGADVSQVSIPALLLLAPPNSCIRDGRGASKRFRLPPSSCLTALNQQFSKLATKSTSRSQAPYGGRGELEHRHMVTDLACRLSPCRGNPPTLPGPSSGELGLHGATWHESKHRQTRFVSSNGQI